MLWDVQPFWRGNDDGPCCRCPTAHKQSFPKSLVSDLQGTDVPPLDLVDMGASVVFDSTKFSDVCASSFVA